jgi:NitT/TauT family transport system substrate-binding protein
MDLPDQARRRAVAVAASLCLFNPLQQASAQELSLRLLLDWQLEGQSALFVLPQRKGLFRQEKLQVQIDPGEGSASTVVRVASGAYDLGVADLASLMEYHANHPDAPHKPVAVMMVYNSTPAAVLALRGSDIRSPADLSGKRLGAPMGDAGRRLWPLLAKLHKIEGVTWTTVEPSQREALLLRGEVDAITGFGFTSLLSLEALGVRSDDVVMLPYAQHGVRFYGNALIASDGLLSRRPDAVKGFLRAFSRGLREVVQDPRAAVAALRAREPALNEALELRRLHMALDHNVLSAGARADGFGDVNGARLALMASQVSDLFATRERVNPAAVWNSGFLPTAAERNVFLSPRR